MATKYEQPEFIQYIRNHYCDFCGKFDDWNGNDGVPVNTPCHIKTRGSGGGDYNNVIPACTPCHSHFESLPNVEKILKYPNAYVYTNNYFALFPEKLKEFKMALLLKHARR